MNVVTIAAEKSRFWSMESICRAPSFGARMFIFTGLRTIMDTSQICNINKIPPAVLALARRKIHRNLEDRICNEHDTITIHIKCMRKWKVRQWDTCGAFAILGRKRKRGGGVTKRILKKQSVTKQTGFIWLWIGGRGEKGQRSFGSCK
jgi:hypothetical protein